MIYAFARDGFLPRALAAVHPRSQAPHAAIAVQSVITFALAVSGTFERLAILANVSGLVLYLGCALAAWRLRTAAASRSGGEGFQVPFGGVIPVLTCLVIAWLMTGIAGGEWLALALCLGVVTLVYAVAGRRRVTA
jgi:amino acid transporter